MKISALFCSTENLSKTKIWGKDFWQFFGKFPKKVLGKPHSAKKQVLSTGIEKTLISPTGTKKIEVTLDTRGLENGIP